MKRSIIVLLLFPLLVYSQELFQKTISSSDDLIIRDIVKLPDNGYLGCGYLNSSSPDSTYAMIIRMDSLMGVQWCKTINMLARDYFRCISPTSDGNFLVGGTSKQDFSKYYGANLYKLDPSGNILWSKIYTANYDDATMGAWEQADQTRLLIIRHGVNGQPTKVIKTDNSGNTILGKYNMSTANAPPGIVGDCAISDGSGNYYIGGSVINGTTGTYVFFVCKINDSAPIWYNEYDFGRSGAAVANIAVLSDENIVVTGYVADASIPMAFSTAVMKLDPVTSSVIWAKEIKQSEAFNQYSSGILALPNSEMIVYGGATTPNGTQAFGAKLDTGGNIDWAREYGGDDNNSFSSAYETSSSRFLFVGLAFVNAGPYLVQTDQTGSSPCNTYDLNFLSSDLEVTLYPQDIITGDFNVDPAEIPVMETSLQTTETTLCSGSLAVKEIPATKRFNIYPNPARDHIYIETEEVPKSKYLIEIYSMQGTLLWRSVLKDQHSMVEIPFTPGIYLISISNDEHQTLHHQKIIIN